MDLVSLVELLLLVFMINQRNKIRSFTEKIKCPLFLLCFSMKYRDVSGKPIISLFQLSPLVKILLLVFIQWNKIRSYTEKIKYSLYIWIWYDHFIVVIIIIFFFTQNWATSWRNQQSECAPSEDSDQPGHPSSLIRIFAVRRKKA